MLLKRMKRASRRAIRNVLRIYQLWKPSDDETLRKIAYLMRWRAETTLLGDALINRGLRGKAGVVWMAAMSINRLHLWGCIDDDDFTACRRYLRRLFLISKILKPFKSEIYADKNSQNQL